MNVYITWLMIWSLIGQFQGGIVTGMKEFKEFFEPVVFYTPCIPSGKMEIFDGLPMTHRTYINVCAQRAVLCSKKEEEALRTSPEMVEWMIAYNEMLKDKNAKKEGIVLKPLNSLQAKALLKKIHNAQVILNKNGIAFIAENYKPTQADMARWHALCKARKDQQRESVIQQKKKIVVKDTNKVTPKKVKTNFRKGAML